MKKLSPWHLYELISSKRPYIYDKICVAEWKLVNTSSEFLFVSLLEILEIERIQSDFWVEL